MTDMILCGSCFWLLGMVWTMLMMAEPGSSKIRLFFGGLLWPILAIFTIVFLFGSTLISPFRKKPTQTEREALEREAANESQRQ